MEVVGGIFSRRAVDVTIFGLGSNLLDGPISPVQLWVDVKGQKERFPKFAD